MTWESDEYEVCQICGMAFSSDDPDDEVQVCDECYNEEENDD